MHAQVANSSGTSSAAPAAPADRQFSSVIERQRIERSKAFWDRPPIGFYSSTTCLACLACRFATIKSDEPAPDRASLNPQVQQFRSELTMDLFVPQACKVEVEGILLTLARGSQESHSESWEYSSREILTVMCMHEHIRILYHFEYHQFYSSKISGKMG